MQENNSERSLNLAHFDTGLAALMSPAIKWQCCQIFIEKQKQTNKKHKKTLKHPNALFYNTQKKSYISYLRQTTLLTP